jgi:uncharacterized protein (DUF4415 family)
MKKAKQTHPARQPGGKRPTATQAADFLEDYVNLIHGQDEPTKLISLRVPANILRSFKTLASQDGRKYQSHIVQLMREWVARQQKRPLR